MTYKVTYSIRGHKNFKINFGNNSSVWILNLENTFTVLRVVQMTYNLVSCYQGHFLVERAIYRFHFC